MFLILFQLCSQIGNKPYKPNCLPYYERALDIPTLCDSTATSNYRIMMNLLRQNRNSSVCRTPSDQSIHQADLSVSRDPLPFRDLYRAAGVLSLPKSPRAPLQLPETVNINVIPANSLYGRIINFQPLVSNEFAEENFHH